MEHGRWQPLDAAVPAFVGLIVVVGVAIRSSPGVRAADLALGVAASGVLFAQRRLPALTLAVSGGLVLALFAVDARAGAIAVIAPAAALYTLALTRGRTLLVIASAAVIGAVVAVELLFSGRGSHGITLEAMTHVALVALPLLAAEAHRTHRANTKLLRERLELAERTREEEAQRRVEHERLRIARDLHDVVAHTLTTINVQAGVAAHLLDQQPGQARSALETIESASHDALDELRSILGVLRDDDGETPLRPTPGLADLDELIADARTAGGNIRVEIDGAPPASLPEAVQLAAYRIVQESLTNSSRHAAGAPTQVHLTYRRDALQITIDSERGDAPNGVSGPGIGIRGMRERAVLLGGTLEAGASPSGFRVSAQLPYHRAS